MVSHLGKLLLAALIRHPTQAWLILRDTIRLYVQTRKSKEVDLVSTTLAGFTVKAYGYSSLLLLHAEIFLQEVYSLHHTRKELFIIDAGANIGLTTLYFKSKCSKAEIWAFEPNPFSYRLLQQNVEENQLESVKFFNAALSGNDGVVDFFIPEDKASLNGTMFRNDAEVNKMEVISYRLSTILDDRIVDVLKLDIEGSEWEVMEDLYKCDRLRKIRSIMMEVHQVKDDEQQLTNLVNVLNANQFKVRVEQVSSVIFGNSVMVYARQLDNY